MSLQFKSELKENYLASISLKIPLKLVLILCCTIYDCFYPFTLGVAQHERLTAISSTLEEDFVDFYNSEIKEQCMHALVLELLASAPIDVYDENSPRQREQGNQIILDQF